MRDEAPHPEMRARRADEAAAERTLLHAGTVAELISCGSIECTGASAEDLRAAAELLPRMMPVFVPHLPGRPIASRLQSIEDLRRAGFDPVPHLAARDIPSRAALRDFLAAAGVHRVLIIGGDRRHAAGPYPDALAVLQDDTLHASGIVEVAFAGHPEGHPELPDDTLRKALLQKLSAAARSGLGASVVTQFSFIPTRIIEYCGWLASAAPDTPVLVGIAGPASMRQLMHFARYCGVAASLSAVARLGVRIPQLTSHMRADEQLGLLASSVDAHVHGRCNITGVHVFSFGGFAATAKWMHERINLR